MAKRSRKKARVVKKKSKVVKKKPQSKPSKRKKKIIVKGSSRYRSIQTILSSYCNKNNIKLGREFNTLAGKIHASTKGIPLKQVENNIGQLLETARSRKPTERTFPDKIQYWKFKETVTENPIYEGITIGVRFDFGLQDKGEFSGDADAASDYYTDEIHRYARLHDKDYPNFVIIDTDNTTFVNYELVTQAEPSVEGEEGEPPTTPTQPKQPTQPTTTVELEKEKQRTLEKRVELQIQKRRTLKAKIAVADKALELIKAGFTKQEALKILGL